MNPAAGLIARLERHAAQHEAEQASALRVVDLIHSAPRCFYRDHFNPGHVTGSALLISRDGTKVLMNHHGALDKWICFGGHADGETNIANVALRELQEESGITDIAFVTNDIFDVDIHPIPANPKKSEPAHEHFDIRFLFRVTGNGNFTLSDESHAMKWCDYEEALRLAGDDSMRRLLQKWKKPEQFHRWKGLLSSI